MSVDNAGVGGDGKPVADSGASESAPGVNVDEIVSKVADALSPKLADMVTGAVKRNVEKTIASQFDGIDFDALKGIKPAAHKQAESNKGKELDPAVAAKLAELQKQVEDTSKLMKSYQSKAWQAQIVSALNTNGANPDALDILAAQFASKVQEDNGKLFVVDGDDVSPLESYAKEYLDKRPGLKVATARGGTGAGGTANKFTEAMPKSKRDLLYSMDEKDLDVMSGKRRQTPERVAAFKAAHGQEAWNKLPD